VLYVTTRDTAYAIQNLEKGTDQSGEWPQGRGADRTNTHPLDSPATRPANAATPTTPPAATQEALSVRRANNAIFVPTPHDVVDQMLKLAAVGRTDIVYDLGCGDGRIVVAAAREFGCHAAGFDTDPECVRLSRENVQKDKVGDLVNIAQKDIFTLDLADASVITLYMGGEVNLRLVPQLQHLKPGSRIVSHNFDIEGYAPDKVVEYISSEDDTRHTLYLWTAPLKKKT
jgi:precorrin-6B methylase 2